MGTVALARWDRGLRPQSERFPPLDRLTSRHSARSRRRGTEVCRARGRGRGARRPGMEPAPGLRPDRSPETAHPRHVNSFPLQSAAAVVIAAVALAGPLGAQQPRTLSFAKTDSLSEAARSERVSDTTRRVERRGQRPGLQLRSLALRPSPQGAPAQGATYMNIGFSGLVDAGCWSCPVQGA